MNPSSRSRFRGSALDRTDGVGKKYELRKSSKEFNYNCRQKIWRTLSYINFTYATKKLCYAETRAHCQMPMEKS